MLGGTVFLGRHLVAEALSDDHRVTIVHRGVHGAELFEGVERVTADRSAPDGLARLAALVAGGRRWDAVVDTSGYVPRLVRESAALLESATSTYCFISSISVYADLAPIGVDETAPVTALDAPDTEVVDGSSYGPLKAACEAYASLVIRPGLIVGPHDPSARFAYWPHRMTRPGPVLAPGPPDQAVQVIDCRDLARLILRCLVDGREGTMNATGVPVTFTDVVHAAALAAGSEPAIEWVDPEFLVQRGVAPWSGLPLWIPASAGMAGFHRVDVSAALNAGMRTRPLVDTCRDTLAWIGAEPEAAFPSPSALLTSDTEAALLAEWAAR